MAERGSGANRAATRAPRRKVSSRKVGTLGVTERSPIRKPPSVVARSATRTTPPIIGRRLARRLLFVGVKTADFELSWAGAAGLPGSAASTNGRDEDW